MSNYYIILGVAENATKDEIKKAYRSRAMVVHPDVNDSPEAQKLFIELAEAYEALFNGNYKEEAKTAIRKYWDTYTPPSDEQEYVKWKKVDVERREFYKQKSREAAIKSKQVFRDEIKDFRKSWFYYPSLIFYYTVLFLFISCPIISLSAPIYVLLNPEDFNFTIDTILLMSVCTVVICYTLFKGLTRIKKVIDPYFYSKNPSS